MLLESLELELPSYDPQLAFRVYYQWLWERKNASNHQKLEVRKLTLNHEEQINCKLGNINTEN